VFSGGVGGGSPLYLRSKQVSERNVIVFIINLSVVFYEFKAILYAILLLFAWIKNLTAFKYAVNLE
jgi:hypothetical protein